jgi:hypothetical protein
MPLSSKPLKHTIPKSDEEVQRLVEEKLGVCPCLWQIQVVCKILAQNDVITIAATGSGKSLTYWMPPLFVKHSVVVLCKIDKFSSCARQAVDPQKWNPLLGWMRDCISEW